MQIIEALQRWKANAGTEEHFGPGQDASRTFEMAPSSVGFGAAFFVPNRRFILRTRNGGEREAGGRLEGELGSPCRRDFTGVGTWGRLSLFQ